MTNILKVALLAVIIVMFIQGFVLNRDVPYIDQDKLDKLNKEHENLIILDVRQPSELTGPLGAIDSAINIPLSQLPEGFASQHPEKDTPIVILCRTQNRSTAAYRMLKTAGYNNLYVLYGGMSRYEHK